MELIPMKKNVLLGATSSLIVCFTLMFFVYPWLLSTSVFDFIRPTDMLFDDWVIMFRDNGVLGTVFSLACYFVWLFLSDERMVNPLLLWTILLVSSFLSSTIPAYRFQSYPASLQPLQLIIVALIYVVNNTFFMYWLTTLLASPASVIYKVPLSQCFRDFLDGRSSK